MTTEELTAIKKSLNLTTSGEWMAVHISGSDYNVVNSDGHEIASVWNLLGGHNQRNAEFIANSRGYVAELVAEVERLQAERAYFAGSLDGGHGEGT